MTYAELEKYYETHPCTLAADLLEAYHPGETIPEQWVQALQET